jgi:hypothetical protein
VESNIEKRLETKIAEVDEDLMRDCFRTSQRDFYLMNSENYFSATEEQVRDEHIVSSQKFTP